MSFWSLVSVVVPHGAVMPFGKGIPLAVPAARRTSVAQCPHPAARAMPCAVPGYGWGAVCLPLADTEAEVRAQPGPASPPLASCFCGSREPADFRLFLSSLWRCGPAVSPPCCPTPSLGSPRPTLGVSRSRVPAFHRHGSLRITAPCRGRPAYSNPINWSRADYSCWGHGLSVAEPCAASCRTGPLCACDCGGTVPAAVSAGPRPVVVVMNAFLLPFPWAGSVMAVRAQSLGPRHLLGSAGPVSPVLGSHGDTWLGVLAQP